MIVLKSKYRSVYVSFLIFLACLLGVTTAAADGSRGKAVKPIKSKSAKAKERKKTRSSKTRSSKGKKGKKTQMQGRRNCPDGTLWFDQKCRKSSWVERNFGMAAGLPVMGNVRRIGPGKLVFTDVLGYTSVIGRKAAAKTPNAFKRKGLKAKGPGYLIYEQMRIKQTKKGTWRKTVKRPFKTKSGKYSWRTVKTQVITVPDYSVENGCVQESLSAAGAGFGAAATYILGAVVIAATGGAGTNTVAVAGAAQTTNAAVQYKGMLDCLGLTGKKK